MEVYDQGPGSWLGPGKDSLPDSQMAAFLLCPQMAERKNKLSVVSSFKGTNPIMRALLP